VSAKSGTKLTRVAYIRFRPAAKLNSNHILVLAFGQKKGGLGRVGFEPKTIGLKVQNGENNDLYINVLPGHPMLLMHNNAQLRTTDSRKYHALNRPEYSADQFVGVRSVHNIKC
jgi:hypothetical protein